MKKARVLIVDDAALIRRLISDALAADPSIEVVGTAGNGRLALQMIPQLEPDLVTLDVEMPEMGGIETLRQLRKLYPRLPVIMFSALTERGCADTLEALSLGASDYATKPATVAGREAAQQRIREDLVPKVKALCRINVPGAIAQAAAAPAVRPAALPARPRAGAISDTEVRVIAMALSTGGPNALAETLAQLPASFPVPIAVVQHMPQTFTRFLAARLNQQLHLAVVEATDGQPILPGTVYVAPGDYHLRLKRRGANIVAALDQDAASAHRPSADVLFRSVAELYGAHALALVMTGSGEDGLHGCEAVTRAGGRVLIQDEATSVVWDMAGRVHRAGLADMVLPLAEHRIGAAATHQVRRGAGRAGGRARMSLDERESTGAFSWPGVEQALDRLAIDVATSVSADEARTELFAIAGAIDDGADAAFAVVADRIRVLASALNDLNAGDVVGAALAAVRARDGAVEAPAPATPADDVAAYASDPELGALFVSDALDHLATIESTILQLETAPGDAKLLNDVFRPFHTVKGNAGVLGLMSIREFAHHLETLLDLVRSGKHAMGTAEVEVVLGSVDLLGLLIRELPARAAGEPGTDVSQRRAALLDAVGALIAGDEAPAASPLAAAEAAVATAAPSTDRGAAKRERADESQNTVKVNTRKLDALLDMVGELVIAQSILAEDPELVRSRDERLNARLGQLKRITSELQRSAMAMRMVPIQQTFQKMARLVRDMARQFDKPITLLTSGEETELDRRVVEHLTDPLMHLIRNCIDHGIETAPQRAAAGKPAVAELRLSAAHQAGSIVVQVSDDGAGLDTDRIRATAIERGLVHADATLTPAEIHLLIFQPGFSTAARVTETSGRGVGMDVVRRNVEALRGRIDIQTSAGRGTTFTIRLPLTLAIVDGLVLSVGAERFVIPTFAVRESLRPLPEQIHTLEGRPRLVCVRDRLIPLLHLGSVFGIAGARTDISESTVVILEDDGRPVALVIDELLGKYEVVIKSLGDAFGNIRGVAGGAILGDGRIGLILDAAGLLALVGTDVAVTVAA